ncbi:hypothetical protein [Arthrobacter sp. B2a2-09]|uniref:hypothetical protein n=1 Tax=Arthrobacter sp. B2a2-09 TaxID=2952822 RepID=UPI0022CD8FB7|nr:hypothetical protein [Arthrobacter sp. B2a2-09]MCZ9883110.1 hypothetical protein [Arthrobacter sp. B2a2-09]
MNTAIQKGIVMDLPNFMALNVLTALNFKHQGFRHEKEVRCVSLSASVNFLVMPTDSAKTIVPWKGSPVSAKTAHQPLPIKEILIGPRATAPTIEAISQCLSDAGLKDLVAQSDLPFR